MRFKRLFYYLTINVLVSACTIFAVISLLNRYENSLWPQRTPQAQAYFSPTAPPYYLTATAQASITPSPTPTRVIVMYQVQPGDTLGGIALQFDVSIESIVQENGLSEDGVLGSGQTLFIPLPSENGSPALGGTPLPPESPNPVESLIRIAYVIGAGDLNSERVRLERVGEGTLSLAGWKLRDQDGNQFTFPQLSLFPGAVVDLYSGAGRDTAMALYWGLPEAIWSPGETVTLLDELEQLRAVYVVP
ncbi:MAG: LysM peptidoglycan-binding domain-containing protein [Anaerolineales bacterium]|jgi:LysM repeat protein